MYVCMYVCLFVCLFVCLCVCVCQQGPDTPRFGVLGWRGLVSVENLKARV